MSKLAIVLGTRPEIIKLAPVIWQLERQGVDYDLVHSGQHYDYEMSEVFMKQLRIPKPDEFIGAGGLSDAAQTASILLAMETLVKKRSWKAVVVQGDTNTVLGASIGAKKQRLALAHVEAGARSFDRNMPEETNRVVCDHLSDVLFAPTKNCLQNLLREGIEKKRITLSGNTLRESLDVVKKFAKPPTEPVPPEFALLTLHRQENLTREKLASLIGLLKKIGIGVFFPVHPRTKKAFQDFGLIGALNSLSNVTLSKPVGYEELLYLIDKAEFVLTDSGGVQEEAAMLGKWTGILRNRTEWVEIVSSGWGATVGLDGKTSRRIIAMWEKAKGKRRPVFAEKGASKKIVSELMKLLH